MAVKMVMPIIPPRARVLTLMVPAVPRRKDGIESVSATTKISVSDLV
jgi:hypothetical protein